MQLNPFYIHRIQVIVTVLSEHQFILLTLSIHANHLYYPCQHPRSVNKNCDSATYYQLI